MTIIGIRCTTIIRIRHTKGKSSRAHAGAGSCPRVRYAEQECITYLRGLLYWRPATGWTEALLKLASLPATGWRLAGALPGYLPLE